MRLLLFFTVFACKGIFAQPINLVPNPGFESYEVCPTWISNPISNGLDQICYAKPWFQPYLPNDTSSSSGCGGSSSDFFHECSNDIPYVLYKTDYQYPKSGSGFAGFQLVNLGNPDNYREYIEVPLTKELNQKKYCVSWYSNLNGKSGCGINKIGALFSKDTIFQIGFWDPILINPQIENFKVITDTQTWVPFHQSFNALGGEKYMTIGNFQEGQFIESITLDSTLFWVYYYFDDFGVYELPEISAGMGGEIDTLGESVALQANCEGCWNDLVYRWWPSAGLSDTTVLNPIATPEVTTTYYFGLIDTSETVPCIVDLVDSVTVFVNIPEDTITPPPTSFSWLVFPSPTSGNLSLQFSGITETTLLQLIDERGRLIRRYDIPKDTQSFPLDLSPFAAGEYFLRLENSTLKEKRKVTKM